MARIEGTQNIPSTWKEAYDGAVTPLMPNAVIRRRYPWRVPANQEGGCRVSLNQEEQRQRWLLIRDKFQNISAAERQRWYDARPIWNSLLWYYNYFMMSGLMGNAVINDKGGGVIKSINHYGFTLPGGAPAPVTVSISAIDPTKSVVFFYGAGAHVEIVDTVPCLVANYPYLATLNSSRLVAEAPMFNDAVAGCSVSVIEYI
jgi:hypothetical protein